MVNLSGKILIIDDDKIFADNLVEYVESIGAHSVSVAYSSNDAKKICQGINFDIIFLDPPYNKSYTIKSLLEIEQNDIIKKNGLVVVQHQIHEDVQSNSQKLVCLKEKKYGKSRITVFGYQK